MSLAARSRKFEKRPPGLPLSIWLAFHLPLLSELLEKESPCWVSLPDTEPWILNVLNEYLVSTWPLKSFHMGNCYVSLQ